jgi:hypothetical protein
MAPGFRGLRRVGAAAVRGVLRGLANVGDPLALVGPWQAGRSVRCVTFTPAAYPAAPASALCQVSSPATCDTVVSCRGQS